MKLKKMGTLLIVGACIGMTVSVFTASSGMARFTGYCNHGQAKAGKC